MHTAGTTGTAMILLLIATPLICLICSIMYGLRHSFHWQFCIIVAILFLPTVLIYYNQSAFIYSAIFGGIALLGNLVGTLFRLLLLKC